MKCPLYSLLGAIALCLLAGSSQAALITSFSDDFNRASLGSNYTSVGSPTWDINGSQFLQETGTSEGLLFYNGGTMPTATDFGDGLSFTASTQIFIGATAPISFGMLLNYQDSGFNSFYWVRFRGYAPDGDGVAMQIGGRDASGDELPVSQSSIFSVSLNTWYTLTVSGATAYSYDYALKSSDGSVTLVSGTFNQDGGAQFSGGYVGFYTDNSTGNSYDDFSVAVVPEPSTLALAAGSLAGIMIVRRRVVRK